MAAKGRAMTTGRHWARRCSGLATALLLAFALAACVGGCKDDRSDQKIPDSLVIVALAEGDLNRDGTLKASAMEQIQAAAEESPNKGLHISFLRCTIRDAALDQLAKVPRLKKVEAVGSPLTDAAVDRLKGAVSGVEVVK